MQKKSFYLVVFLFAVQIIQAQITVDSYGTVGMPTIYQMPFKCQIKGNLLLTSVNNYGPNKETDSVFFEEQRDLGQSPTGVELRLRVSQTQLEQAGKATIGASNGEVRFWTDIVGYNTIRYLNAFSMSDATMKTNIVPLTNALNLVNSLKAYSYNFKPVADSTEEIVNQEIIKNTHFGFLSQEVEEILPDLVTNDETGIKMLDYTSFTPLLAIAIQEQQQTINLQQEAIEMLRMQNEMQQRQIDLLLAQLGGPQGINFSNREETNNKPVSTPEFPSRTGKLYDCVPNPFSVNTEVKFEIPENAISAHLIIYDLNGAEIKTYNIEQKGIGTITINGNELKAGMYVYTLLIDNKIVDTKRMVLTK